MTEAASNPPDDSQGDDSRCCIFCGSVGPLNREHIWPDWMNREFPELSGVSTHFAQVPESGTRTWQEGFFSQRAKVVCAKCNGGWMSDLEVKVRPILARLARGRPMKLGPARQQTLACWIVKSAFVRAAATDDRDTRRQIPTSERRAFFASGLPPEQVTVWTAFRPPQTLWSTRKEFFAARIQPIAAKADADPEFAAAMSTGTLYGVTLGVGFAAFQMWGSTIPEQAVSQPQRNSRSLKRIWPVTPRFQRPPREPLDWSEGLASMPASFFDRIE